MSSREVSLLLVLVKAQLSSNSDYDCERMSHPRREILSRFLPRACRGTPRSNNLSHQIVQKKLY